MKIEVKICVERQTDKQIENTTKKIRRYSAKNGTTNHKLKHTQTHTLKHTHTARQTDTKTDTLKQTRTDGHAYLR